MGEFGVDKRQVFLAEKLNAGVKLTVKKVLNLVENELGDEISKRTAERDLDKLLDNFPDAVLEVGYRGVKTVYAETPLNPDKQSSFVSQNFGSQLLSLNMLKAHLTAFKGSIIEEQVDELIDEIEKHVGEEDLIAPESLYWDQNYGKFNYQKDDTPYLDFINQITESIKNNEWIWLKYKSMAGKISRFSVKPYQFFYFNGTLYFAAYYPTKRYTMSLAIQNILSISSLNKEELEKLEKVRVPEFNYENFRAERFGVFRDEPQTVVLEVDQAYRQYFLNRKFHDTQRTFNANDESEPLVINMKVPLATDLVAWILKWNGGLKVKSPQKLKDMVKQAAREIIKVH